MKQSLKVSIVIPCYNESQNIPALVQRCKVAFAKSPNVEVVLVDNGSTDDSSAVLSQELLNEKRIRTVRVQTNQGYGFGILSGLRVASGDVLAWTHADMQTDPADLLVGMDFFERDSNPSSLFVKGQRYGRPLSDVFFTVGMSFFESILLRRFFWDINAQPTMFHRQMFETWIDPPHDFSLDLYAYFRAKQTGCRIKRFPVRFGARLHGQSRWNINWQAKIKFIKRTVAFSLNLRKSFLDAQK